MILEACVCSDVGKKRTNNEDNLYFNGQIKEETASSFRQNNIFNTKKDNAVFGVFDGMGGYAKGEVAASITAKTTKEIITNEKNLDTAQLLNKICVDANVKVCKEIEKESVQRMGSTLSMLYFDKNNYHICDVGDSPIYLCRGGKLKKISLEHTEAATYAKIYGELPPKNKKFPLTQHIGMSDSAARLNPYYTVEAVCEGDMFLICSDGLSDMVDDSNIEKTLLSDLSMSDMADKLLSDALENGGIDNITFIIIKVVSIGKEEDNTEKAMDTHDSGEKREAVQQDNNSLVSDKGFIIKCTVGIFVIILLILILFKFYNTINPVRPTANNIDDVSKTSSIDTKSTLTESDTDTTDIATIDNASENNKAINELYPEYNSAQEDVEENEDFENQYLESSHEQNDMYRDVGSEHIDYQEPNYNLQQHYD